MSQWHKYPKIPIPRAYKTVWLFSRFDGVFLGTKGMGIGEWYNSDGNRPYAITHWMPFTVPQPPMEFDNGQEIPPRTSPYR